MLDKSVELIQEAMKTVIAEFVINLPGDNPNEVSPHLVFIHSFDMDKTGKIIYDFSTPSEDMKEELRPHIETIFQKMLDDVPKEKEWKTPKDYNRIKLIRF